MNTRSGSIALGTLVLVAVFTFMTLLYTLVSRCKKIRPRTIEVEETNSFGRVNIEWNDPDHPLLPEYFPTGFKSIKASQATDFNCFTGTVVFAYNDSLTNSSLLILRSQNWIDWAVLSDVWFGEDQLNPDSQLSVQFIDPYAPTNQAYYRGLVITNSP